MVEGGELTLHFDTATGEVRYLTKSDSGLAWQRILPPPPGDFSPPPPHHPPAPGYPHFPQPHSPPPPPQGFPPTPAQAPHPFDGATFPGGNPRVDPNGFRDQVDQVGELRRTHSIDEQAFLEMAAGENTVILDARSREKFALLHVRGAVNLSLPDMTASELEKIIPSKETRILIYCNNNFANSPTVFPEKVASAALNLHTFTTLSSYGYRNVFELGPLLDGNQTRIPLEGRSHQAE